MSGSGKNLPFFIDVARENVEGVSCIFKFGENPDIDILTAPEDVWDGGGLYNFTADGGAAYYISSSNNTDTQDVRIYLLSEDASGDWNSEEFVVTLVGQAKTLITTPSGDDPVRIYRMINEGATDIAGTVYVYEDDTVVTGVPQTPAKIRAQIIDGNNQTLMGVYTIPSGSTGYITRGFIGATGAAASQPVFSLRVRPHGQVFATKAKTALEATGTSLYPYGFDCISPLPSKTDVKVTVVSVGADNTGATCSFEIVLMPNIVT